MPLPYDPIPSKYQRFDHDREDLSVCDGGGDIEVAARRELHAVEAQQRHARQPHGKRLPEGLAHIGRHGHEHRPVPAAQAAGQPVGKGAQRCKVQVAPPLQGQNGRASFKHGQPRPDGFCQLRGREALFLRRQGGDGQIFQRKGDAVK